MTSGMTGSSKEDSKRPEAEVRGFGGGKGGAWKNLDLFC